MITHHLLNRLSYAGWVVPEDTLPLKPAQPRTLTPTLLPGLLAFFVMGAIQATYGPSFPALQAKYGLTGAVAAWIASVHFIGSSCGPIVAGFALTHFSTRRVVNAGILTLLLGAVMIALAPLWWAVLLGAFTAGLGLGVMSAALNTAYAQLGTRQSSMVNALFGVGSLVAPLIVAVTLPIGLSVPYLIVAALSGLTLLAVWQWNVPEVQAHTPTPLDSTGPSAIHKTPWSLMVIFPAVLVAYVALEVGFGAWIGKHLSSLGWANPALFISGYWGGLTVGRLLTSAFGPRFSPPKLVLGAALLTSLATLCALLMPGLAPFAYVLAGVALGPVFSTSLVWMSGVLSPRMVPFLLISGNVGGIISPALIGWLTGRAGPSIIPTALLVIGLVLTGLVLLGERLAPLKKP